VLYLRSLIFNIAFYINLTILCIIAIPTLFMPYRAIIWIAKLWARTSIWLLRVICNTKTEFRGLEKIPKGAVIAAAKHQSIWETFALMPLFDDPVFILKRELMWLPFFGWYLWKGRMIAVDRGARSQALNGVTTRAKIELALGRQLLIFPEGTRRPAEGEPRYKYGTAHIYGELGLPCVPIALNSGLFWPRRTFLHYPGTIVAEVLDPMPAGLTKEEFAQSVKEILEVATAKLIAEGKRELAAHGYTYKTPPRGV
jgi:1-acyl-sn-glycerol-3-phosphate acyltransferase